MQLRRIYYGRAWQTRVKTLDGRTTLGAWGGGEIGAWGGEIGEWGGEIGEWGGEIGEWGGVGR